MSRVHNMSLMRSKQVSEEISELSSKMKQRTGAVGHSMTLLQASIKAVMERPTQVVGYLGTAIRSSLVGMPEGADQLSPSFTHAPSDPHAQEDWIGSLFKEMSSGTLVRNALTLFDAAIQGLEAQAEGGLDDRKLLLEHIIVMLQNLPPDSPMGTSLTNALISFLWADLDHPPVAFVGGSKYRSADGSGNNPFNEKLGASGTYYARSVAPIHPLPQNLPDPATIFDALHKREKYLPHPSGISSLLFSFATTIIHSCFESNRADPNINDASSYLDLSIIYGNNEEELKKVRTYERGHIHPDVVSSFRLFLMPPAVTTLAVLFSRNHNLIADQLLRVNEQGRFTPKPPPTPAPSQDPNDPAAKRKAEDPEGKKKQDEDLFQTARLVNCGFFLNVIFQDYIRVILNVSRTVSLWSLIPTGIIRPPLGQRVPRGVGNAVSVEFNMLYRWHSAISAKDEQWLEMTIRRFVSKPYDQMTEEDFYKIYYGLSEELGPDVKKWNIPGLKRNADGRFNDTDLVRVLTEATDEVASAIKARGTPAAMRVIDIMGMNAARTQWQTASLNEFRAFLGLEQFSTFEEWNSDPEIARVAKQIFVHPDNIELFSGLHAEESKPSIPGSGLAPGYTISRAILSDATALVRGDRYFCQDFNAANLTVWAFEEVTPDTSGGSFGGIIGKLLMRVFPHIYKYNSIYALFPFSIPKVTRNTLTKFHMVEDYDFERPVQPRVYHTIQSYQTCAQVIDNRATFTPVYGAQTPEATFDEKSPYALFDLFHAFAQAQPERHLSRKQVLGNALFPSGWETKVRQWCSTEAAKAIRDNSWSYDHNATIHLDVVRDVAIHASMNVVARQFGIPLKTEMTPRGFFTAGDLYRMLMDCYTYTYLNFESEFGFALRERASRFSRILGSFIQLRIATTNPSVGWTVNKAASVFRKWYTGKSLSGAIMDPVARQFYTSMWQNKGDMNIDDLGTLVASNLIETVNIAHACANVVDFYIDNAEAMRELTRLSREDTTTADSRITGFVVEALRQRPIIPGVLRKASKATQLKDGSNNVQISSGEYVFTSFSAAGRDNTVFKNAAKIDAGRQSDTYSLLTKGLKKSNLPQDSYTIFCATEIVKEIFKLKGLRREPGVAGQLNRIENAVFPHHPQFLTAQGLLSSFPQNLGTIHDGPLKA